MLNFAESGHPIFRASCAVERGDLRSKGHGKNPIQFNGSEENIELLLCTIISANQLSVFGAVADLCRELSKDSMASEKPEAYDHLETVEIPTEPPTPDSHTDEHPQGNLLQDYDRKFEQLTYHQKLSKLCSDAGLKTVERVQFFITLYAEEGQLMQHLCREYTVPRNDERTRARGWIQKNTKIGPVLDAKVCRHQDRYGIEIQVEPLLGFGS